MFFATSCLFTAGWLAVCRQLIVCFSKKKLFSAFWVVVPFFDGDNVTPTYLSPLVQTNDAHWGSNPMHGHNNTCICARSLPVYFSTTSLAPPSRGSWVGAAVEARAGRAASAKATVVSQMLILGVIPPWQCGHSLSPCTYLS